MKVVIQRCKKASVSVNNKLINNINYGMVVLVGFTQNDNQKIINEMVNKIVNLRIYDDEDGIMNKSILDIEGEILSISQFTLYADTKKGNRPSYINALNGEESSILYDLFNKELSERVPTKTGTFGANMNIALENDGPVTIIIEK